MAKILIVEDDEKIAWLEKDYLESNGYETDIIDDGRKVIPVLQEKNYDLVLLDLMLPGLDGYAICRKIRDEIDIPILMVTARADDYITKPFDPSQLVARVRAHLKRYERLTGRRENAHKSSDENGKLKIQDVVVETMTWKVWKKGREIRLPNREFELLRFLAENPNIVFSKEELFEKIWGFDYISDAATVSVHINRLREKIEDDARNPQIIETVWGAGYRLNP